jgi:uncharacterized membrane protein
VGWFDFLRKKPVQYFAAVEMEAIVQAIRNAEKQTSGEVRVFIESRCSYVDPVERAKEIFFELKMEKTKDRNAVLLYIAMRDRQLALFADEGIYEKCGQAYWETEVKDMLQNFKNNAIAKGIIDCVSHIGQTLKEKFPFEKTDKNELPDEIVFGK